MGAFASGYPVLDSFHHTGINANFNGKGRFGELKKECNESVEGHLRKNYPRPVDTHMKRILLA